MASGSQDYWSTKNNWMYSLLTIVKDAIKEGGSLQLALDSMDGKLDGFIDLADLTEAQTVYLSKMFLTDTVDGNGKNLLTKLDNLDGVADGKLDLSKLNYAMYESHNNYPRYETNQMVSNLITAIDRLNQIRNNTGIMAEYGQADTGGTITPTAWTLISDVNERRSMLEITHVSGYGLYFSRNGSTNHGSIPTSGSTLFFDAPGVWLKSWSGGNGVFSAHEEWAT